MKNGKEIMILASSVLVSLAVGALLGCTMEKMKKDCFCVIDEL